MKQPVGSKRPALAFAACALLASTAPVAAGGAGAHSWIVQVRDTPPAGQASFVRGADRSYTVTTGSAGERDDAPAAGNGYTLGAGNAQRQLRVREGDRLRVDLPAVQSLQFHLPLAQSGATGTAAAPPSAMAGGARSGVSGVVYFEAVAAFAASFRVAGTRVHVDLVPLRVGGVEAPLIGGAGPGRGPVAVEGRLGEWIALGDTELPPARSLSPTAEPPSPASVWVRVLPDDAGDEAQSARPPDNSQVVGTGQR